MLIQIVGRQILSDRRNRFDVESVVIGLCIKRGRGGWVCLRLDVTNSSTI